MFHLRRAAARALSQSAVLRQPSQYSTSFNISRQSIAKPSITRSIHQSLRRCAGEKDEATPQQEEPSPTEMAEDIQEESINASSGIDALNEASGTTAAPLERSGGPFTRPRRNMGDSRAPKPSKILYIGNISFDVTAAELEEELARHGNVVNCRVVSDPQGMSKGFGYVEYSSQEEADHALEVSDGQSFQGRRMRVDYHIPRQRPSTQSTPWRSNYDRPPQPPSKTLFIGNMSYQMSDRDLNELFREVRDVLDVRVAIDRRSGQPRGFAHADFVDIAAAEKAKQLLSQKIIFGRQLKIDFTSQSTNSRVGGQTRSTPDEDQM